MKRRTIAIATSIAALSLAAAPIAAASTDAHSGKDRASHSEKRFDRKSPDVKRIEVRDR